MSYVGTNIEIVDQSAITSVSAATTNTVRPTLLFAASADKGTEDLVLYDDAEVWLKQYGRDVSFKKHGQPLLEAANAIKSGAKIYFKRIVASDANLANAALVATVTETTAQKKNSEGALVYVDADGKETTTAEGNTAVMVKTANVSYQFVSVADAKTMETVVNDVESGGNVTTGVYPLFVLAENGRGISKKKFRIYPDYALSKKINYTKYVLDVFEASSSETLDTIYFSMNPDQQEFSKSMDIQTRVSASSQLRCKMFETNIDQFYAKISEITGISVEQLQVYDILSGCDKKGTAISNIKVEDKNNMTSSFGITFANGSNGAFGEYPVSAATYETRLTEVFNGTFTDEIYDLDNTIIDIIPGANYPASTNRAIESLVSFREDCVFLRDLGVGLKTYEEIAAANEEGLKNYLCATYCTSYDIIDPYTKKQIGVTIMYDMVEKIVAHFQNGRTLPMAGFLHGFTFPNAIKGTLNFCPKRTPKTNQKEALDDLRVNYAAYYDDVLTLETLYTSQEAYTELSFINNVLAVQEVIKAIRNKCPKIRYSLTSNNGLKTYQEEVNKVIEKYQSLFKSIKLVYGNDPTMEANKIYYALLSVQFESFFQSEYFKVTAIPTV